MSRASLCGPTNALTALQKHATSDRTLQQDRLRGSSIPQGFRSSHVSNINHEFDQFSHGPQDFFHAPPPSIGAVPNWAAEFQQLRISNPPPLQHTIPRNTWASPVPATAAASWHTEFLAHLSQPTAYTPTPQQQFLHHQTQQHLQQQQFLQHQQLPQQQQQQQQQQQSAQFSGPELRTHSPSEYDSPNYLHDSQDPFYAHHHLHSDFTTTNEAYSSPLTLEQQAASDAAFALAFDEAQRWHLESTQHDLLDSINEPAPLVEESPEQKGKGKEKAEDPDELSRTAGHLLESLASEQSQKFKESNFMKLMRQLRDKEVKVEGGEMVAVGGAS